MILSADSAIPGPLSIAQIVGVHERVRKVFDSKRYAQSVLEPWRFTFKHCRAYIIEKKRVKQMRIDFSKLKLSVSREELQDIILICKAVEECLRKSDEPGAHEMIDLYFKSRKPKSEIRKLENEEPKAPPAMIEPLKIEETTPPAKLPANKKRGRPKEKKASPTPAKEEYAVKPVEPRRLRKKQEKEEQKEKAKEPFKAVSLKCAICKSPAVAGLFVEDEFLIFCEKHLPG